jgi:APA family basic amino acid/polyamine antiporter
MTGEAPPGQSVAAGVLQGGCHRPRRRPAAAPGRAGRGYNGPRFTPDTAAAAATPAGATPAGEATLVRGLGTLDATLLTVGSVVGTGIFLTTSDMARVLPRGGWILAVWVVGGLLTLAGALTYAELGVMYPRAGGLYHYLKEAYGPLPGFLFGWASFLVIMTGGAAALAVGFAEYLGSFVPAAATDNVILRAPLGPWTWTLSGGQVAAILAVLVLTAVNHVGLRAAAGVQNALTLAKIAALAALGLFALVAPMAPRAAGAAAPMPGGGALLTAFGVAMIAALWTYDGWYGLTCSAGEVRDPARVLPRGLIAGTGLVMALYLLANLAYLRALPISEIAAQPRVAEATAAALAGPLAARAVSAVVLVSTFGCLAATILYSSRIYQPMAADGLFFRSLAVVDPRHRVPVRSLWAQSVWSCLLAASGTYAQLYTYVIFASVMFHAATAAAVFVLRRKAPDLPRPYRAWGYPVVPALFILGCLLMIGNTLVERPFESIAGLGLLALGLPAYALFRNRSAREARAAAASGDVD